MHVAYLLLLGKPDHTCTRHWVGLLLKEVEEEQKTKREDNGAVRIQWTTVDTTDLVVVSSRRPSLGRPGSTALNIGVASIDRLLTINEGLLGLK
jgi:hypothetical protein